MSLAETGQAFRLDFLRRSILNVGQLIRLIGEDGLRGWTSNPSIFEEAIGEGLAYDDAISVRFEGCGAPSIDPI